MTDLKSWKSDPAIPSSEVEEEGGVVRSGKDRREEMQQDGAEDAAQRSVGQENAGKFVLG